MRLRQLRSAPTASPERCPVSFWDYVIPAAIGGGTGLLSGFGVRWLLRNDHQKTADSAAHIVEGAVTLLVGGMAFILRTRYPRLQVPR